MFIVLLSLLTTATPASLDPLAATILEAQQIQYVPVTGQLGPAELAVIFGDPNAAGPYVLRMRFPANAKVAPHYHGESLKIVSLVQGTIAFGYGERFDATQLQTLAVGSIWTEPRGQYHFGQVGPHGATIEVHGVGPVSSFFAADGKIND